MSATTAQKLPQSHLLPLQNKRLGSANNELDNKKRKYIIEMRKNLCDKNIIQSDGSLNLKYFNVKKGQYWSLAENSKLIDGVLKFGATDYKKIKSVSFLNWSETEIKLRICRLFKVYDLSVYAGRKFSTAEEIAKEAKKNKEEGNKQKKLVGGVYYNPTAEEQDSIFTKTANSSFNKSKTKPQ